MIPPGQPGKYLGTYLGNEAQIARQTLGGR